MKTIKENIEQANNHKFRIFLLLILLCFSWLNMDAQSNSSNVPRTNFLSLASLGISENIADKSTEWETWVERWIDERKGESVKQTDFYREGTFSSGNVAVITSVFDGPLAGGIPKGVEIYILEDIADLLTLGLGSANNGGGTDGIEFTFPAGSASAGDYIYVASEATQFTNFFGFVPDYTSGSMAINGDDAIELFHMGAVIDVFGDINTDGTGTTWDYEDGWASRKNGAVGGGTFDINKWTFSGINALDGEVTNASATTPVPIQEHLHVYNSSSMLSYGSIQAAIDDAATLDGHTIEVLPGTYDESVLISKELTINGPNADVSAVTGSRSTEAVLLQNVRISETANVSFNGFEFYQVDPGSTWPIYIQGNSSDFAIMNNRFIDCTTTAIRSGNSSTTMNLTVEGNLIDGITNSPQSGMAFGGVNGTSNISYNKINNTAYGGLLIDDANGLVIKGNEISNTPQQGLQLAGTYVGVTIEDNNIYNTNTAMVADKGAIRLYGGTNAGSVNITNNALTSSYNGIAIKSGADISMIDIVIENNDLEGNSNFGLYNGAISGSVDATCNWWGSATGPDGSDVSGSATTIPYRTTDDLVVPVNCIGGFTVHNVTQSTSFATIQEAIDDASTVDGDVIEIEAGTYVENVVVNKELTIKPVLTEVVIVSGSSGNGFTISSDNVTIENIEITGFDTAININGANDLTLTNIDANNNTTYAINVATGPVEDLTITNGTYAYSSVGMKVASATSIDGLTISGTYFSNNNQGFAWPASNSTPSDVDNVNMSNVTFLVNAHKGIYTEKLSNAVLDNVTFDQCGIDGAYNWNTAIDLNLKYGNYSNITIKNSSFINSSHTGTNPDLHGRPVVAINPRDGSSGTLDGLLFEGNSFASNPGHFLNFGEIVGVSNAVVKQNDFSTLTSGQIAIKSSISNDVELDCNWHVSLDKATIESTFVKSSSGEILLNSYSEDAAFVSCAGFVQNLNTSIFYPTIQSAIDDATANDVIQIEAYTFNERVVITKSITLQGATADETLYIIDGSTGVTGTGSGIYINTGVTNVNIKNLTIQNFIGANGYDEDAGITAKAGNNDLLIDNVAILDNVGGSGFYANGPVDGVTVNNCMISGHTADARGIVIWNGLKTNINITNNVVINNNCCGIELQDGDADGVLIQGNTVTVDAGDSGMGLTGMTNANVDNNTISGVGRFGIEIKNPNGNVSVTNNVVFNTGATDLRDYAGIAVFRRAVTPSSNNVDIPNGVSITGNSVTGYKNSGPIAEGFGIVVEGTGHAISGNTLANNNIGIQLQGGGHDNANFPVGDGDQAAGQSPNYFGRGNSPVICDVTLGTNTFTGTSNDTDLRLVRDSEIKTDFVQIQNSLDTRVANTTQSTNHCSIQEAVDAATAGDILVVESGAFYENVTVHTSVEIRGSNYGISPNTGTRNTETIIYPANSGSDAVFDIQADNVVIDGVTIDGDNISITTSWPGTNGADIDVYDGIVVADAANTIVVNGLQVRNNIIQNILYFGVDNFGWYNYSNPTTSGHLVSDNLFQDLGSYTSGVADYWGGGVLLYNDQYTRIVDNVMINVRIGIQTGNFHDANTGVADYQVIDNNTIQARRRGIFYNLHTGPTVSPWTVSNNTIIGLADPNETGWDGILASSLSEATGMITGNIVDGSGLTIPTEGIEVWNVKDNAPVNITGGEVKNVDIGIFVNSFEGYNSNAGNGGHTVIDGVKITDNIKTGIHVKDSPDNTSGSSVSAEIKGNTEITTNTTDGIGIHLTGAMASANIHDNLSTIEGNDVGILVDAGSATITNNTIKLNNKGILFKNAGTGSATSNNIFDNVNIGVENTTGAAIDAIQNWWGDASGPSGEGVGSGDGVSTNIEFCPWLGAANDGVTAPIFSGPIKNNNNSEFYCSIQEAIDDASDDDVIVVGEGTFAENLTIDKPLTLNGANLNFSCGSRSAESIIAPSSGIPVVITADGVTINGFEITAPSANNAIVCSNTSNTMVAYNNIHNIGDQLTSGNVHAIIYTVGSGAYTDVSIINNCFDEISSSSLTQFSASAIGILQSTSTGELEDLVIQENTINDVEVKTDNWPAGKIAYGIQINVGGNGSYLSTTGNVLDAKILDNEISNLSGYISTGIGMEGNTENAEITGNIVSDLFGRKDAGNRSGGAYDLQALKFENNRYVGTCLVTGNNFATESFTHDVIMGRGYAIANYVATGQSYAGSGTTSTLMSSCNWYGSSMYSEIIDNPTFTGKLFNKSGAETSFEPYLVSSNEASAGIIGFQPETPNACNSAPVTIDNFVVIDENCDAPGSISVSWSDGFGPFDISWTGGSMSNVTSPYVINNLTNGTYNIVVTAVGSQASSIEIIGYRPVKNGSTYFATIQGAINAASANDIIEVCSGTYNENININKALTLQGPNVGTSGCGTRVTEAILEPATSGTTPITIASNGVTISGFALTNPDGNNAIVSASYSDMSIINNVITGVGINATSGNTHAIYVSANSAAVSNVSIENNKFINIRGGVNDPVISNGSASAVLVGDSNAANDVTTLSISNNCIDLVRAATIPFMSGNQGGKGAYGILLGFGGSGGGKIVDAQITNNEISDIEGRWAHAIGLEGNTPSADVLNNKIDLIIDHKSPTDAVAILLEDNSDISGININNNSFTNVNIGVWNKESGTVDASCNYWGTTDQAMIVGKINGPVTSSPYLTDGTDDMPTAMGFQPAALACGGMFPILNVSTNVFYPTIQDGIDAAIAGQTLEIQPADYTEPGQIVVDKDITLRGLGKTATILRPGINTGTSGNSRGFILVNAGIEFNLEKLTINGLGKLVWQAVRSIGSGTVDEVYFTNIKYQVSGSPYAGTAYVAFGAGNVDVSNSMFDEIGRIGMQYFGTGITGSSFTNNTYTGKGIGDWIDYMLDINAGAIVTITGNTVSGNIGSALSDGSSSAGILVSTFNGMGTEAIISNNTITGNSIGIAVGYDGADVSVVTANNNNIVGNTFGVTTSGPLVSVDATTNWWGNASGPAGEGYGSGDSAGLNVDFCPWLDNAFDAMPTAGEEVGPVKNTNSGEYFCTIQEAIDDGDTDDGDIIEIVAGTYSEKVVIDKPLTLQGASTDKTLYVIDGAGLTFTGSIPGGRSGIKINSTISGVTIKNLTVRNFNGFNGNSDAGIYAIGGNNNLTVDNVAILDNVGGSGFYANGPINDVTINGSMISGHTVGARGIVIWNGFKDNINITNNSLSNNNCCGIELQDGTASNVNISYNTIAIGTGDNAIGVLGLNDNTGSNTINNNIITGGGRYGIEIKNPNGGITVHENNINLTDVNGDLRDRAGIVVMRRDFTNGNPQGYADIPNGVTVTNNTVTNYKQSASAEEGFGIVIEGSDHVVSGNELTGNDVGIQLQGGGHANANYVTNDAGSGSQNTGDSPSYFGRGNSPTVCNIDLGSNTFNLNGIDERLSTNDYQSSIPFVEVDEAVIDDYLAKEISYTINGTTVANTNNGMVDTDENVIIQVCDVDDNVTISLISPGINNLAMKIDYTGTNLSSPPVDADFKVKTFNANHAGLSVMSLRLADPAISGKLESTATIYNDANDNGIQDPFECVSDVINVEIIVNPQPNFEATLDGTPVANNATVTRCEGDMVTLGLSGTDNTDTYSFKFEGNEILTGTVGDADLTIPLTLANEGAYELEVTTAEGCSSSLSYDFIVNALPDAEITADYAVWFGSTGHMASVPDAGIGADYLWSITNGMIVDDAVNPIEFYPSGNMDMVLSVEITNGNNCVSTNTKVVKVIDPCDVIDFSEEVVLQDPGGVGIWSIDRYAPSLFEADLTAQLVLSISSADGANNRPANFISSFYNTQGRRTDVHPSTQETSVDVFIPSDWASTGRRMVGFWGEVFDASNALSGYPIIEFTSDNSDPRFRIYNNGAWADLGLPAGFIYDEWVTMKMSVLPSSELRFSIEAANGHLSYTSTDFAGQQSTHFENIILQGHNTSEGVTYDIFWDNLVSNPLKYVLTANSVEVLHFDTITYCEGDQIEMELTGTAGDDFKMSFENGTDPAIIVGMDEVPTIYSFTADLSDAGKYTLEVTNDYGCTSISEYYLEVNPKPIGIAESTETACSGAEYTLTLDDYNTNLAGSTTYEWVVTDISPIASIIGVEENDTGSGDITHTATNPYSVVETIEYTVTPTSSEGCEGEPFIVKVELNNNPSASYNPNGDMNLCHGETRTILGFTPSGDFSYLWEIVSLDSGNASIASETMLSPILTAQTDNENDVIVRYTITNNETGCSDYVDIIFEINAIPSFDTSPTDLVLCEGTQGGGTAIFDLTQSVATFTPNTSSVTYHTSASDANAGIGELNNATMYTATDGEAIHVRLENNGCYVVEEISLTVNPIPVVSINAVSPQCPLEDNVLLGASPNGGTFSGTGVNEGVFNPSIAGPGMHTITYTVTVDGCTSSGTTVIEVTGLYNIVMNINDSGPGSLRDIVASPCVGDTIYFNSGLLPHSTIALTSGEIEITEPKVIKGLGRDNLTISGSNNSRIFNVMVGGLDSFEVWNATLINGVEPSNGGAILNNGNLILKDVTLEGNKEGTSSKALTNNGSNANLTIKGDVIVKE